MWWYADDIVVCDKHVTAHQSCVEIRWVEGVGHGEGHSRQSKF